MICVEIGVFKGDSLLPIAATLQLLQQGKIYAVDPWSNEEAIKYLDKTNPYRYKWARINMRTSFNSFKRKIADWKLNDVCEYFKLPSAIAVKKIAKYKSIDFLHIDGNSSKEGSLEDVKNYLPLVKSRGYVLLSTAFLKVHNKYVKSDAGNLILDFCEFVEAVDDGKAILYRKR